MKVLILLLLTCCIVTLGFGQSQSQTSTLSNFQLSNTVVEARNSVRFVVIIRAITTDPIEGYWLLCQCGTSRVLIWEDDVQDLEADTRYYVLCTYLGAKRYPKAGEINIYDGIVWEAIE